jgi:hypothetical protein
MSELFSWRWARKGVLLAWSVALAVAALVAGCASTVAFQITSAPPGRTPEQVNWDNQECHQLSASQAPLLFGAGYLWARSAASSRYSECMEKKGYEVKKKDEANETKQIARTDVVNETKQATRTDEVDETKLYFKNTLSAIDQLMPRPNACAFGAAPQGDGYIINLASWAEQAGLRRGDRIKSIAGVPTSTIQDLFRGLRSVPSGGPLVVEVTRGAQAVAVSLACKDPSETWATFRKALAAGADGRWDDCTAGIQQYQYLVGLSTPYSELLFMSLRCMSAKNASSGKRDGIAEARVLYEVNLLRLRESRYVPEGLDKVRGAVLPSISLLRTNGFASLASDLEIQLHNAEQTGSVAQEPLQPSAGPTIHAGTAFIARSDGMLLSAFHVIQGANSIKVTCPDLPPSLPQWKRRPPTLTSSCCEFLDQHLISCLSQNHPQYGLETLSSPLVFQPLRFSETRRSSPTGLSALYRELAAKPHSFK